MGDAEFGFVGAEVDDAPPVAQPENIQASDDFVVPDYGMTFASASLGVEYQFFAESPFDPEAGPFLWVIYSLEGRTKLWEKVFLDFIPSAIYAHTHENNMVLVGGQANDGTTILVEFEFQLTEDFKVLRRAEPFADVSQLGSLCDIWTINFRGSEMIFVLDGRFGQWGTVERGLAFSEISIPQHRLELIGKRHFIRIYSELLDLRIGFSPQLPGACVDEPEQAWFRLESLDSGKSFHKLSLEDAGKLLWDRVFEEPKWGMESAGGERGITFEFWSDKPFEEHGNVLDVTFSNGWVGSETFPLDFSPTALMWMGPGSEIILVGGKDREGSTVLFEVEVESQQGKLQLLKQERFAEVSELGGICDLSYLRVNGEDKICLFDGRTGRWGTIERGGKFKDVSTLEQRGRLMGLKSFAVTYPQVEGLVLSFSPLDPSDPHNPYPEDVVSFRSLDDGKSFSEWKYTGRH